MKKLGIILVILILSACSKDNHEIISLVGCWNVIDNTCEKYYFSFSKDTVRYYTSVKSGNCKYEIFRNKLFVYDWCEFNIDYVENERICLSNDDICLNICKNYSKNLE